MLNNIAQLRLYWFWLLLFSLTAASSVNASSSLPIMRGIGGDFTEESSLGHKVSLSDYKGNVVLLTFGFTNCPDVCPITLGYLQFIYGKLTVEQQKKVKVFFVTVDTEHDNPEHMRKYLKAFNKNFIGITPDKNNLPKIAENFGISYAEIDVQLPTKYNRPSVEIDQDDTTKAFNHSVSIFLLDTQNLVRGIYYSGSDSDYISSEIGKLLLESSTQNSGYEKNNVSVENFWIRLSPNISKVTAMYGEIINNSDTAINLTGVLCEDITKKVELHLTTLVNNQSTMVRQLEIYIAPYSTLIMKPMHYHAMLMGLKRHLIEDEKINCSLEFSNNMRKTVSATVKKGHSFSH